MTAHNNPHHPTPPAPTPTPTTPGQRRATAKKLRAVGYTAAQARETAEAMEPLRERDAGAGSGRCRVCGCTDNAACPEGCFWVEADLCSACSVF